MGASLSILVIRNSPCQDRSKARTSLTASVNTWLLDCLSFSFSNFVRALAVYVGRTTLSSRRLSSNRRCLTTMRMKSSISVFLIVISRKVWRSMAYCHTNESSSNYPKKPTCDIDNYNSPKRQNASESRKQLQVHRGGRTMQWFLRNFASHSLRIQASRSVYRLTFIFWSYGSIVSWKFPPSIAETNPNGPGLSEMQSRCRHLLSGKKPNTLWVHRYIVWHKRPLAL